MMKIIDCVHFRTLSPLDIMGRDIFICIRCGLLFKLNVKNEFTSCRHRERFERMSDEKHFKCSKCSEVVLLEEIDVGHSQRKQFLKLLSDGKSKDVAFMISNIESLIEK
jgi:hypothetical protein